MAIRKNAAKGSRAASKTETSTAVKTVAAEVKAETPAAAAVEVPAAEPVDTTKKAPAKKAPAKKADPKASVVIEFAGKQTVAKEVLDKAVKAYEAAHKGVEIKTIEVYVKPEENVAYYVVNGEGSDDYKVTL